MSDRRLDVHEPPAAVLRELLAPVVGQARAAVADDVSPLSIELVERHDPCVGMWPRPPKAQREPIACRC